MAREFIGEGKLAYVDETKSFGDIEESSFHVKCFTALYILGITKIVMTSF